MGVAGDETTGRAPGVDVATAAFARLAAQRLAQLRAVPGLTATASDVLDELGLRLAVPAGTLVPRSAGGPVAGHVVTLAYLPERRTPRRALEEAADPGLAHLTAFEAAEPGDVVVIDVRGSAGVSVLGGMATHAALAAGVAGCIVDGAIRDLGEIRAQGLPVWSRSVTPVTGKWRLQAVSVNRPVACAGVQVRAGDLALADETGICFVPAELAAQVTERVLEVARREAAELNL
jgi:4-hydroxy-4-methyl-2-oxoglutarate aldolase